MDPSRVSRFGYNYVYPDPDPQNVQADPHAISHPTSPALSGLPRLTDRADATGVRGTCMGLGDEGQRQSISSDVIDVNVGCRPHTPELRSPIPIDPALFDPIPVDPAAGLADLPSPVPDWESPSPVQGWTSPRTVQSKQNTSSDTLGACVTSAGETDGQAFVDPTLPGMPHLSSYEAYRVSVADSTLARGSGHEAPYLTSGMSDDEFAFTMRHIDAAPDMSSSALFAEQVFPAAEAHLAAADRSQDDTVYETTAWTESQPIDDGMTNSAPALQPGQSASHRSSAVIPQNDNALIDDHRNRTSATGGTGKRSTLTRCNFLRRLSTFLDEHVDAPGPQGTRVAQLCTDLCALPSGSAAIDPRVQAARAALGPEIVGVVEAVVRSLRWNAEDEERINLALSGLKNSVTTVHKQAATRTAERHRRCMKELAIFLRFIHVDKDGAPVKTFTQLCDELCERPVPAGRDNLVQAFRQWVGVESDQSNGIAAALNAALRLPSSYTSLLVMPDDEKTIQNYVDQKMSSGANRWTVVTHRSMLRLASVILSKEFRDKDGNRCLTLCNLRYRLLLQGAITTDLIPENEDVKVILKSVSDVRRGNMISALYAFVMASGDAAERRKHIKVSWSESSQQWMVRHHPPGAKTPEWATFKGARYGGEAGAEGVALDTVQGIIDGKTVRQARQDAFARYLAQEKQTR